MKIGKFHKVSGKIIISSHFPHVFLIILSLSSYFHASSLHGSHAYIYIIRPEEIKRETAKKIQSSLSLRFTYMYIVEVM